MHTLFSAQDTGPDLSLQYVGGRRLTVHHKRYIEKRQKWEYKDSDLITLCKSCHTLVHEKQEIPIFNSNGQFLHNKKFPPEDYSSGHNHDYKPWIFINMDYSKRNYKVSCVKPVTRIFVFAEEMERINEIEKEAKTMLNDFFERFLPDYKQ